MIGYIILGIIALVGLSIGVYFVTRRGSKIQYVDDEPVSETVELTKEEEEKVIEATFEVLEVEKEQDEEFNGQVTKIEEKVDNMSNVDLAQYINEFLGVSDEDNPISRTNDKSKFDWEREGSKD